jgi:hypothetical protein
VLLFFLNTRCCREFRIFYEGRSILMFLVLYIVSCVLISVIQWYAWKLRVILFLVHFIALGFFTYNQLDFIERVRVGDVLSRMTIWRYRRGS